MATDEKIATREAEPGPAPTAMAEAAPAGQDAVAVPGKAKPPARSSASTIAAAERAARDLAVAGGSSGLVWSFVLCVLVPALAALLYIVFIAKPQYISETRFVVRGTLEQIAGGASPVAVNFSVDNQESHIIAAYIRSRAMVEAVMKTIDLRAAYPTLLRDPVFGLAADSPMEDLVKFWNRQVVATVEPISSVIKVSVRAFSPEDAVRISEAVLKESERIVNEISFSGRTDRVAQATTELGRAEKEMRDLRADLERLRNDRGTIDPTKSAMDRFEGLAKLRDERSSLNTELLAVSTRLSAESPVVRALKERLRSMDDKIAVLETDLLGAPGASPAQPSAIASAADLEARRKLATDRLERAEADLVNARSALARQSVYVMVFMHPTLAQEYGYPLPFTHTALVAAIMLMVWMTITFSILGIRTRTH